MNRIIRTLILALIIFVGGWALFYRDQIQSVGDAWQLANDQMGIDHTEISSPFKLAATSRIVTDYVDDSYQQVRSNQPWVRNSTTRQDRRSVSDGNTIRIASFKLHSKSDNINLQLATEICEQYDVVAIQNNSTLSISKLVNQLNKGGLEFRFVDKAGSNQKFATIFNQQTVVLDNQHWYSVNDPEDLFQYEPLVAWFRVRNAPYEEAFTFSLVNIQLNDRRPDKEVSYLGVLFRAIRMDGRGEDDIIIAGDFHSSDAQLNKLHEEHGLTPAIIGKATNTRNDTQLDNLVFDERATVEFTGDSGVFDFMKRFNMTLAEALDVSNRMPVWAEFSILEGRSPGRAADNFNYIGFEPNR